MISRFVIIPLLLYQYSVLAANIEIEPGLNISETFTDNINLDEDELANSDFITVITPRIEITNEGNRVKTSTRYLLQEILYKNTSSSNLFHTLDSEGEIEFIKDHLFTELHFKNGQQNISSLGNVSSDNLSNTGNQQNVFSYELNPYWKQNIFKLFEFTIGNQFDEIRSDGNNSESNRTYLNINNRRSSNKIQFDFDLSNRVINSENNSRDIRFTNSMNRFTYLFSNRFSLTSSIGYEDNNFQSNDENSGLSWNLGLIWHPSLRTNLQVSIGKRFFGTDLSIDGNYRTKKGLLRVRFTQTPETSRDSLLSQQSLNLIDSFGTEIEDPNTSSPSGLDTVAIEQRDEVIVMNNLLFSYEHTLKRNKYYFLAKYTERDFQLSGDSEEILRFDFNWHRRISRTLNLKTAIYSEGRTQVSGNKSNRYNVSYSLDNDLSKYLDLELGFRHVLFETDSGSEFFENRAFLGLRASF